MNRRLLNASVGVLALLAAACGKDQGKSGAADETASFTKAGEALEAKVGAPGEKAEMPAASDPDVQAFEAAAQKGLASLGTPALPVEGLDSYDRLCGPAAKITAAYVSAGLGATGDSLPMADAAKVAKMNRNAERYMAQMFTPLLFSAHCTAVHLPAIDKALAGQDLSGKASAIGQIRGGAYGQVSGLLQMAGSTDLDAAHKQRIMDLLAGDAAGFAIVLTQAQRQELAQMADSVGQAWPEGKAQAGRIRSGLQQAPCGKLCTA